MQDVQQDFRMSTILLLTNTPYSSLESKSKNKCNKTICRCTSGHTSGEVFGRSFRTSEHGTLLAHCTGYLD